MSKTYQTAAGGLNASFAVTGEGLFLAGLTDGKSSRAYLRAPLSRHSYSSVNRGCGARR